MGREDTRIYVGNLPPDVREKDIEDIFAKYGKIRFVDIKGGRGPLYAFVEFEDPRLVLMLFFKLDILLQFNPTEVRHRNRRSYI
ncbi:hypothetical protein Y032_0003g1575 [Ancylostoma ceylanicum]|uniref:RRM domain-containing protein n=1 Tax=Ancylostoma ceylanicum TaxID=53326 RepID=A0A016VYP2_9BILA|nr:hypothetical protein Y032_0003g1575 [Ancylostoma ceylanicum]